MRVSPVFAVPSPRLAAEYWRDVFGFDLDPDEGVFAPGPTGPDGVYAIVTRGGISVHFQLRPEDVPQGERSSIATDAYFYVEDADALFAELLSSGAKVIRPIENSPYGLRDFMVEDLNRYRVLFGAPIG